MALFFSNVSSCCGMFSCSVCRRSPWSSALDSGALSLPELSVLLSSSLAACFCINLCPRLSARTLFPHYVYPVCCSNHSRVTIDTGVGDRRLETVVTALCFLITNTFAFHHVTVRFGSLSLHVFRCLYLGALSKFPFPVSATLSRNSSANIVHHDPYGSNGL